eukprot:3254058-Rhodomonas_salina.2
MAYGAQVAEQDVLCADADEPQVSSTTLPGIKRMQSDNSCTSARSQTHAKRQQLAQLYPDSACKSCNSPYNSTPK